MSQICVEKKSKVSGGRGDWGGGGTGRADATRRRQRMETRRADSVRMRLFAVEDSSSTGGDSSAADDLHPPLKSVFALRSEIVDVGFEMQFEHVVLVDVFRLGGDGD